MIRESTARRRPQRGRGGVARPPPTSTGARCVPPPAAPPPAPPAPPTAPSPRGSAAAAGGQQLPLVPLGQRHHLDGDRHRRHPDHEHHRPGRHRRSPATAPPQLATGDVHQRHRPGAGTAAGAHRPDRHRPSNNQVHLTWNASDRGAHLHRQAVGHQQSGPFTSVAHSGLTSHPATRDTGLTNGTTYWFVVSASNPSGHAVRFGTRCPRTPRCCVPRCARWPRPTAPPTCRPDRVRLVDLILPNVGGGVDVATLTSANVFLRRASRRRGGDPPP